MADRPIIFSAPMVRALLDGRKTQTRRVLSERNTLFNGWPWSERVTTWDACDWPNAMVDDGPSPAGNPGPYLKVRWPPTEETLVARVYPTVQPGDRLWVREAWRAWTEFDRLPPRDIPAGGGVQYVASDEGFPWDSRYRHSQFMPRWASRLTLIVERVRVERLQDIREEDARAEGVYPVPVRVFDTPHTPPAREARPAFARLWEDLNGPDAWDENPWVAAITFRTILANIDSQEARND